MAEKKIENPSVSINTNTVIGSTYAQIARVTVTDIDITIEFAFVHPAEGTSGQSVARITMPLMAGVDLGQTILTLAKVSNNRKEGKKND